MGSRLEMRGDLGRMVGVAVAGVWAAATWAGPADAPGAKDARLLRVPGSSIVFRLWDEADANGDLGPHYAVSLDDGEFGRERATSYDVMLRGGAFDPLAGAPGPDMPPVIAPALAAGDDTDLYIVQFLVPPLEEFRAVIRGLGGTVYKFMPHHCHVVRMAPGVVPAARALPFVRWIGPYHPAYRVGAFIRDTLEDDKAALGTRKYNIMVWEAGLARKQAVARLIEGIGGRVDRVHAGKYLLEATLDPDQLLRVVRRNEVAFVDRWSAYESDMNIARDIGGANVLENLPEGYTGSGVRGEVLDVGFNLGHVDFQSRPLILHTSVGSDSHGAATSGIVFGDGTGDAMGRGMLPEGQGIVAFTGSLLDGGQPRFDHTAELLEDPFFAVFQTASVGSARTFFYTTISADHDDMLFDLDIVHCQSQSNAGNQDSRPQAWAKNVISGGGVRHRDTLSRSDDFWGAGASTGPAADGRIKPDLTHFYDNILTVTTGSDTAYTETFGGTSGATPIICGHVGLFFQMWADGAFGNEVDPDGTVFENRCHMTTCKAMMINTAAQYDWTKGGSNGDLTRFRQGWGMPNLANMHDLRFRMLIVDEADLLEPFGSMLYTVNVTAGEPALKATMTYADPAGLPSSSQHRINDLTLKVTSPSGLTYWGNNGLIDDLWSTPGGEPNDIDTVENVFIEDPQAGQWSIEVIAFEVVEDGHVETPEIDADYALVVSGVEEILPPLFMRLLDRVPEMFPRGTPLVLRAEIRAGAETIVAGTETLHYRFDSGEAFTLVPLENQGGDMYLLTVPGASCADEPEFFLSAEGDGGSVVTIPSNAPDGTFGYEVGETVVVFTEDFESDTGWTVENEDLQDGAWERAIPTGGGDRGDPPRDFDGSGTCFVTDNEDGNSDVDGGPTRLLSPLLDATVIPDPAISYARWFTNDDSDQDRLVVEISDDGGTTWTLLESVPDSAGWQVRSFRIEDFVTPNDRIRLRFSATDNPNDSVTEAGVDAIEISAFVCDDGRPGDVNGDGVVDVADLLLVLAAWGECPGCPEDLNGDGVVTVEDLLVVLANWG